MITGNGKYKFRVVEGWGLGPAGRDPAGQTADIAIDSKGQVYVSRYAEGRRSILTYDSEGRFLKAWGEGIVAETHYIGLDQEDMLYLADPADHVVRKVTADGDVLMTLGTPGQAGETGRPFNEPAKAVVALSGDIYVADGYGQNYIHRFSPDGELLLTWGGYGSRPGRFNNPHGIAIDGRGRILVADRWNNRIQVFDENGEFLSQWSTWDLWTPHDVCVGCDELVFVIDRDVMEGRINVFSPEGILLARWSVMDTDNGRLTGLLHGIAQDSQGDLYLTDMTGVVKLERL